MELILIIGVVCGIAGAIIRSGKGGSGFNGFLLGFFLGPIGLIIAVFAGSGRQCPFCKSSIHPEAVKCPRCQSDLTANASPVAKLASESVARLKDEPPQQQAPVEVPRTIFCRYCQTDVRADLARCPQCGGLLSSPVGRPEGARAAGKSRLWLIAGVTIASASVLAFAAARLGPPAPSATATKATTAKTANEEWRPLYGSAGAAGESMPTIGAAPKGSATQVAAAAIKDADHPCGRVVQAMRRDSGDIRAICSNGEAYRVFAIEGRTVALRCSAAARLGVSGC
jgi:hypothetical protein